MRQPTVQDAPQLRAEAEAASGHLPSLILAAERLAAMVAPGAHGLRRAGPGEDFWQYRPASSGDGLRAIDWRRSARSDAEFVRDREAQTAQSAAIWISGGQGMRYAGDGRDSKLQRARLIALALSMLLLRGGEKVALLGQPARAGRLQADRMAEALLVDTQSDAAQASALRPQGRVILISDFLTDPDWLPGFLDHAAGMGVRGIVLQILDPDEAHFPFDGAVDFRDMAGGQRHLSRDAGSLREAYLARLNERREWLADQTARRGWQSDCHVTDEDPATRLAALWSALGGGR